MLLRKDFIAPKLKTLAILIIPESQGIASLHFRQLVH